MLFCLIIFDILSVSFLSLAAVTCVFSLICALVLAFLDKRAERILQKEQGKTGNLFKDNAFSLVCFPF